MNLSDRFGHITLKTSVKLLRPVTHLRGFRAAVKGVSRGRKIAPKKWMCCNFVVEP